MSLRQREDELNNSRSSFLDAEKELQDMSNQMESLTKEMLSLRDAAADAESHRKLAGISLEMRDRASKLDEELRMATMHFQRELTRQEKYIVSSSYYISVYPPHPSSHYYLRAAGSTMGRLKWKE